MQLLDNIHNHADLVTLDDAQRAQLCGEIRTFLVSQVSQTGGHLASNLGVVELTVAVETVFDTHKDRLVFDVGHQSYVHKLLTGRQADFQHLRQFGGMAGFPKPSESEADAFVAGHASSSVSIALGMARARTLQNENYNVIALLGDGAATGGMVYEGLNDAADSAEPLVVILNDNEMSIDRNVGGLAHHLRRLRTQERYLGMKAWYRSTLRKIPGGKAIYRATRAVKEWLKRMLLKSTIFENMGLAYMGPVDGHDLPELIRVLKVAKDLGRPILVHVLTQKGKGYKFAEDDPSRFHGVGPFDPETGAGCGKGKRSFSDAFGASMVEIASRESRVCAITAAMPGGTGLLAFRDAYPQRLFDVGIAEEHAVSMAGGLAKQGMIPVVAIYSTFLQRAYDQILQDVSMLKLHVVFAVDRAGLVGEDGETHHGVFDVGYLRQMPGMQILCPASCEELEILLDRAVLQMEGPVAVRYPRGGNVFTDVVTADDVHAVMEHRTGTDLTVITYGTLIQNALQAVEFSGADVQVLRLTQIHPLPVEEILQKAKSSRFYIVEEVCGGIGGDLTVQLHRHCPDACVTVKDLGREYVPHGSTMQLYTHCGLDPQTLSQEIRRCIEHEN